MAKKFKLVDFSGLQTLSRFIKQAMEAADSNTSAVSGLGEDLQGLVDQLNTVLQEIDAVKANIAIRRAVTIQPSAWVESLDEGSVGYPYKCVLSIQGAGVDAESRVDLILDPDSAERAGICGMCPATSTVTDGVVIRCRTKPEEEFTGQLYITEGAEYPAKATSEGQETE